MARLPRPDLPGIPQHIVQRGNNRLPCFLDDEDRQHYLRCLLDALGRLLNKMEAVPLAANIKTDKELPGFARIQPWIIKEVAGLRVGLVGLTTPNLPNWFRELEPAGRARYAGPVGWVDATGNGEWAVGIRSAEISGRNARVWAGVGVVSDSDPDAELAETRAKFQALLSALLRP